MKLLRWLPALAVAGLIFFFSSQPKLDRFDPMGVLTWDKAVHFIAYFALAAAVFCAVKRTKGEQTKVFILTALYGASDEIHQHFVPGRSCDGLDLAADCCGALLLLASIYIRRLIDERRKKGTAGSGT